MIIFDGEGAAVHANEAAVAAFGPIATGIPLQRRLRAPEMQQLIEDLLSGKLASAAVDYTERVPIERVFRVIATRIEGEGALFALVFKDQSETRRIDRMRADFIANASHELRTPLASIAGFVETLRGPARDDAAARDNFLKIMQEQTGRMARLIDDLLSLSRLEMKPFLPPGAEVDLRQTIDSVIDSLGPLAREAGVEIISEFPGRPGDRRRQSRRAVPGVREPAGERLQIRPARRQGDRLDRPGRAGRPRATSTSPSGISVPASPANTFPASPSASIASMSRQAAAARAPASAWRSSSTS